MDMWQSRLKCRESPETLGSQPPNPDTVPESEHPAGGRREMDSCYRTLPACLLSNLTEVSGVDNESERYISGCCYVG
jgi:hypothetical protein